MHLSCFFKRLWKEDVSGRITTLNLSLDWSEEKLSLFHSVSSVREANRFFVLKITSFGYMFHAWRHIHNGNQNLMWMTGLFVSLSTQWRFCCPLIHTLEILSLSLHVLASLMLLSRWSLQWLICNSQSRKRVLLSRCMFLKWFFKLW